MWLGGEGCCRNPELSPIHLSNYSCQKPARKRELEQAAFLGLSMAVFMPAHYQALLGTGRSATSLRHCQEALGWLPCHLAGAGWWGS